MGTTRRSLLQAATLSGSLASAQQETGAGLPSVPQQTFDLVVAPTTTRSKVCCGTEGSPAPVSCWALARDPDRVAACNKLLLVVPMGCSVSSARSKFA